jgi:hypothetical protein
LVIQVKVKEPLEPFETGLGLTSMVFLNHTTGNIPGGDHLDQPRTLNRAQTLRAPLWHLSFLPPSRGLLAKEQAY